MNLQATLQLPAEAKYTKPKVFVSGCFDMLHSGHVEFLQWVAQHGEVDGIDSLTIQCLVLQRTPDNYVLPLTFNNLNGVVHLPNLIDLAVSFTAQPFVSKHHPGLNVTLSIESSTECDDYYGIAIRQHSLSDFGLAT